MTKLGRKRHKAIKASMHIKKSNQKKIKTLPPDKKPKLNSQTIPFNKISNDL